MTADPRRVLQLAPDTGGVLRTIDLPRGDGGPWFSMNRLALGGTLLWAIGADGHLLRIDPASASAPTVVPRVAASAIAADEDGAWAVTEGRRSLVLVHVSADARVTDRVPVVATELDGLAAGAGALWVTAPQDGLLWRITPDSTQSIAVGAGARGVAVAGGSVWVANAVRGTVTKGRPAVQPRQRGGPDRQRATCARGGRRATLGHPRRRRRRRSRARCGARREWRGDGAGLRRGRRRAGVPERLIVSDLQLHRPGIGLIPDAIAFVLRQHEFRAGRFRIGYQSCDDSTARQGDFEPEKCRANAGLYARTPRVVGIVGPYNSGCTDEQLAITNRAGPLATISLSNTVFALTMPVPGDSRGAWRSSTRPGHATTPAWSGTKRPGAPPWRSSPANAGSGASRSCATRRRGYGLRSHRTPARPRAGWASASA